jgi:hypothetical protein
MIVWSYTFTPHYVFQELCLIQHKTRLHDMHGTQLSTRTNTPVIIKLVVSFWSTENDLWGLIYGLDCLILNVLVISASCRAGGIRPHYEEPHIWEWNLSLLWLAPCDTLSGVPLGLELVRCLIDVTGTWVQVAPQLTAGHGGAFLLVAKLRCVIPL